MGNYMVVNKLKSPYEISHSKKYLMYMIKKIKIGNPPKMIMIWTYENILSHSKVHNVFLVNFFLAIFLHIYIF